MRLSLGYPELFASVAAGGGGYATEKRISEEDGYENPKLRFADGDNVWDLARSYAKTRKPALSLLIYVGTEGFNYPNNLEYMKFLKSLGVPHDSLVVEGVPHSGKKIYEKAGLQILRHHAKQFASSEPSAVSD